MGGDRGPVWAVLASTGNVGSCVSCPLSAGHIRNQEIEEAYFVANIKSQIKRIKTNEKARLRNKAVKSSLKTAIRKAREAAAAGDVEKATEYQRAAARQLDKAVSKGVIHKNQAANKKSALASKVETLKG